MRTRALTWSLGLLAAQVMIVEEARADQGKAVLTGIVRDATTGKAVQGAVVVVQSESLQGEQTVTTDSYGLYRIPNLPSGDYVVQVLSNQYEPSTRKGVTLRPNATIRYDIAIAQGATEDKRTIVVESPTVDVGSATTGLDMDNEFTQRVPIVIPGAKGSANRSFESVAEATPGAQADLYGTSIAGTTSPENQYIVDGLSVNDPGFGINGSPLSTEFLTEVSVVSGGYMPEYGRSTGGVINATTETGSNEFHGSVWGYYTPGQLEGRRKIPRREGSTIVTERELNWIGDAGFDLGGRLIRDRLWFYTGFQVARTVYDIETNWYREVIDENDMPVVDPNSADGATLTERIPGTGTTRKAQATTLTALAKLTFRANEQHSFDLLGVYIPTLSGGNGTYALDSQTGTPEVLSGLGDYTALAHKNRTDAGDLLFTWNAASKDKDWTFDTKIGWHHQRDASLPSDGSAIGSNSGLAGTPAVIWRRNSFADPTLADIPNYHSITDFVDIPNGVSSDVCSPYNVMGEMGSAEVTRCPVVSWASGGPGFVFDRQFERVHGRHIITKLARGLGHHVIKVGVDAEYMQYTNQRAYTGGTAYRESVAGLPGEDTGTTFQDYRQFGYINGPDGGVILDQIKWTVNSVTVGAFLQDSWNIMDKVTLNAGLRYDAQFMFNADRNISLALPNQISPRVGIIWDPTYNGRSKIFANYARYYQSIPLDIADRAGSGDPQIRSIHDASVCDPRDLEQHRGICRSNDSRVPFAGAGEPEQLWLVTSGGRTPIDQKIKPQSSDEFVVGGEYEILKNGRLGLMYQRRWLNKVIEDMSRDEAQTYFIGNPGYGIAQDFPKARRNYDAVTVYFQKRFTDNWLATASYTASWLRGNIAGLYRPETGQLDPNINADFDLQSLLENRSGYLPGDSRHSIKVFSAGDIPLSGGSFLMLGGSFRASSGGPTSYLASHPLYGPDESFVLPRGSGERLPWVFRLDTNVGYRYHINEDLSIAVTMDVFNVANFQAATAVDERYTLQDVNPVPGGTKEDLATLTDLDGAPVVANPNFGNPITYQSPRQFRFGVRFNF